MNLQLLAHIVIAEADVSHVIYVIFGPCFLIHTEHRCLLCSLAVNAAVPVSARSLVSIADVGRKQWNQAES